MDNLRNTADYVFFNYSGVPGLRQRVENPVLPSTVSVLETSWGSKIYVVGTAHFSQESRDDVAKVCEICASFDNSWIVYFSFNWLWK